MFLFIAHVLAAPDDAVAPDAAQPCHTEDEVSALLATQRAGGVTPDVLENACSNGPTRQEMQARTRPSIEASDYPKDLTGEARCAVHLVIDARGKVEAAVPHASCPDALRATGRKIGMRYNFYPKKVDGKGVKTDFDVVIAFYPPAR